MHDLTSPVPPEKWGRDHFQVLGYAGFVAHREECSPDREKMRAKPGNPMSGSYARLFPDKSYPTRLRGGEELHDHDDWDCFDDLVAAGLFEHHGTGANPVWRITDRGARLWSTLIRSKGDIGGWKAVTWEWLVGAGEGPAQPPVEAAAAP
jgi:hypothetical protein